MKLHFIGLVGLGLVLLSGCSGDERLAEKARIEGREQAGAGITAQNDNLLSRATEMESDLAVRHRFYQALRGDYQGSLRTEQGSFSVRITLVPSLPPYAVHRTRQLDEISADLNNLYLSAQVVQWNPANRLSAVGCRVEHIRPDMITGEISIASESCPNLYSLRLASGSNAPLAEPNTPQAAEVTADMAVQAVSLAASIREGRMNHVSEIRGEVHPTTNAAIYQLSVSRISSR